MIILIIVNNIFYHIDYITYICAGHGVSFLKYFLYEENSCYGKKRYNKILIPPSKIFLKVVQKYGWDDENIIKMNLPRWDRYNNNFYISKNTNNKSIFAMFTWRLIKKDKSISIYFTLHHKLKRFKNIIKNGNYVKYIKETEISQSLSTSNLIVSDFSSIIFDFIYRRMPFIMYIPDAIDPGIKNVYEDKYYELINSLKNGTIIFENKFFDINNTIKKILYYIRKDFILEPKIEKFYDSFGLKKFNSTSNFINYLKALK